MDKQQILEMAKSDPRFSQAVLTLENQLGDIQLEPEQIDELVKMLEYAIQNPDKYDQVIAAAVQDGYIDEGDLPPQFNPVALMSLLVLLYGMQERSKRAFARGGLAKAAQSLRKAGRNGDTVLAHINPREAEMLRRAGGSGDINPNTGLPEYGWVKSLFKAAVPIALSFIAPGVGTALSSAMGLGLGAAGAGVLGGMATGALGSAITGGDAVQGAVLGALGGGAGGMAGSAASDALGLNLSSTGQSVLGGALTGAGAGALTGQGVLPGAMQGAMGQYAGSQFTGMGPDVAAGGKQFGNMLTAGYSPNEAAAGGVLSGLASNLMKPSQTVLDSYGNPVPQGTSSQSGVGNPAESAAANQTFSLGSAMKLLPLAGMLGGAPGQPQAPTQGVSSASQQEYFNRPSLTFDWDRIKEEARAANQPVGAYMAANWDKFNSGAYNQVQPRVNYARGGPLQTVARMAQGSGSGRADTIDAKLSDGEYVIDAETVALLGDGSNKAGASALDRMREQIRAHKGKTLAKGKFSPDAKSPLQYLKGSR